ncbi:MAG: hypothetical protein ACTSRE_09540 [Promethearchaeota archaeon]
MVWQDIVLALVNLGFVITLIPQVVKVIKTKSAGDFAWTSTIFYWIGLYAIGGIFLTLEFYLTSIPYFITGTLWGIIVILKKRYNKKE